MKRRLHAIRIGQSATLQYIPPVHVSGNATDRQADACRSPGHKTPVFKLNLVYCLTPPEARTVRSSFRQANNVSDELAASRQAPLGQEVSPLVKEMAVVPRLPELRVACSGLLQSFSKIGLEHLGIDG
jgi:hypothetical protein